jgi:hypothetical protein
MKLEGMNNLSGRTTPSRFKRLATLLLAGFCIIDARSQGTFQNLNFESTSLVPIPGDPHSRVQFAQAFPGWAGYVGTNQQTAAQYNQAFLDSSGISIIDHGSIFPPSTRVIEGNFTAVLIAGFALGTFQPADTTLAQSGLIPAGTQSLLFNAYFSLNPGFGVTLGGQLLSLLPIRSDPNSTLYGADIHAYAGQSAELAFTAFAQNPHMSNNYLLLDSIQFSNQPIPEPSVFGFFAFGVLLLGWRLGWKSKS